MRKLHKKLLRTAKGKYMLLCEEKKVKECSSCRREKIYAKVEICVSGE